MEPSQEQIDAVYRERVLQARNMSPDEKIRAGFRLFERECQIMRDEIRSERPDATEAEVEAILRQRLEARRRSEYVDWAADEAIVITWRESDAETFG